MALKGTPAKLVGIIDNVPDENRDREAIVLYDVPINERRGLMAQQRG